MKIFNAFKYAFSGIRYCFLYERNFVIQLIAAGVVCVAGFVFKITTTEWFAVLFLFGLVLAFEMINTALEKSNLILKYRTGLPLKNPFYLQGGAAYHFLKAFLLVKFNIIHRMDFPWGS